MNENNKEYMVNVKKRKSLHKNISSKIKPCSLLLISMILYLFIYSNINGVFAMEIHNHKLFFEYSFKSLPNFIEKRSKSSAVMLQNGNVFFSGGANSSNVSIRSTEIYDTKNNKFIKTADMNVPRYNHSSILFIRSLKLH